MLAGCAALWLTLGLLLAMHESRPKREIDTLASTAI